MNRGTVFVTVVGWRLRLRLHCLVRWAVFALSGVVVGVFAIVRVVGCCLSNVCKMVAHQTVFLWSGPCRCDDALCGVLGPVRLRLCDCVSVVGLLVVAVARIKFCQTSAKR